MFVNDIAYIANYLWQKSLENINTVLTEAERGQFNIADYYYLTTIHYMGRPNFGEVSAKLGLTKPAISALVRRLTKAGFLEKQQSSEDKRIYYLVLTDKGARIIAGDNEQYLNFRNILYRLVTPEQITEIECLLEQAVSILKNEETKSGGHHEK